jgi:hypothetical protein
VQIPVIVLTSDDQWKPSGAYVRLAKPCTLERLLECVADAITKRP